MSDRVLALALVCVATLGGLALWLDPASGKEIASAAVGAIAGALSVRATNPAPTG